MKNEVIQYSVTDAKIAELTEKYTGLKAADAKQYKGVLNALTEVRGVRIGIEKQRKELKADALEYSRNVDKEAKRITQMILEVETPLKEEKEAYDAEKQRQKEEKERIERERIESIYNRIDYFKEAANCVGESAGKLQETYNALKKDIETDVFDYQELVGVAREVKTDCLNTIEDMLIKAQEREAEEREKAEAAQKLADENKKLKEELAAARAKESKPDQKIESDPGVETPNIKVSGHIGDGKLIIGGSTNLQEEDPATYEVEESEITIEAPQKPRAEYHGGFYTPAQGDILKEKLSEAVADIKELFHIGTFDHDDTHRLEIIRDNMHNYQNTLDAVGGENA